MATTTPMATLLSFSPKHLLSFTPHYPSHLTFNLRHTIPQSLPQISLKTSHVWRISAVSAESLPSEVNALENTEIVSTTDDGVSNVISVLLFIAFLGLSILTIGVIYIAVTDFLQKREKEKFEKEEASKNKKKKGKKVRPRARAGPRGFGQKVEEEDED